MHSLTPLSVACTLDRTVIYKSLQPCGFVNMYSSKLIRKPIYYELGRNTTSITDKHAMLTTRTVTQ